ncbi:MAG: DUF4126 family protein [Acidobacteriaceae bacterium]
MLLLCAFLVGLVAGLRCMMAPAIVSWSARLGVLNVGQTIMALMNYRITAVIFTVLALAELINDKLPRAGSRKRPLPFTMRILSGSLVGATVGASGGQLTAGLICGAIGAVAGTLGGAWTRAKLAAAFGRDFPAAILEDIAAIAIAIFAVRLA